MPKISQVTSSTHLAFRGVLPDEAHDVIESMRDEGWHPHSWQAAQHGTVVLAFTKLDEKMIMANVKPVLDEVKLLLDESHELSRAGPDSSMPSEREQLAFNEGEYRALRKVMSLLQRLTM